MEKYFNNLQDAQGDARPNVEVRVKDFVTGSLATIYEDDETTTITQDATFKTNTEGEFTFKAMDGVYRIEFVGYAADTLEEVIIYDPFDGAAGNRPHFNTYADAQAGSTGSAEYLTAGPYNYIESAVKIALTTGDAKTWTPAGLRTVGHFDVPKDGSSGHASKIQDAVDILDKVTALAAGGDTGVAAEAIYFESGVYDFEGNIIEFPNHTYPQTLGGFVLIKNGGFRCNAGYDQDFTGFRFVDPVINVSDVSGISIAAGVITVTTATAHGLENDDFVRFRNITGTTELNEKGDRIQNKTSTTFELATIDGTGFSAWVSGGEVGHGACFEFRTNNVSRSTINVRDCHAYGNAGDFQCFVSTVDYDKIRSTSINVENCKTSEIDLIGFSEADVITFTRGFYWHSYAGAAFILRGMATFKQTAFIPDIFAAGARYIDYDTYRGGGANGLTLDDCRFSGEGGGIAVLYIKSTANDLASLLNRDKILFKGGYISAREGGVNNNGGVITLMDNGAGGSHCPNIIQFVCTPAVYGSNPVNDDVIVMTESGNPPALDDRAEFIIDMDAASMGLDLERRFSRAPYTPELAPYLSIGTRELLKGRAQEVSGAANVAKLNILEGSKIFLSNGGAETDVDEIENLLPGDEFTIIAQTGESVKWTVPHNAGGTTVFYNAHDVDFDPMAPESATYIADYEEWPVLPTSCTMKARSQRAVLTGSVTWDVPNLADGATAETTVTVTGADSNDYVRVLRSGGAGALRLNAQIKSTDTVTIQALNESGSDVNLASGTFYVEVAKRP